MEGDYYTINLLNLNSYRLKEARKAVYGILESLDTETIRLIYSEDNEQLEAHLCPLLQRHLAENLFEEKSNNRKQVIITTHSTHIASYLDLDNTVVLFKDQKKVNAYLTRHFVKTPGV